MGIGVLTRFSCRRLDNKFNILEGLHRNYFFIGINIIMMAGQVMIVFLGGRAFSVKRLNRAQWAYSLILGALSVPIAVVIRLVPDEFFVKLLPERMHRKKPPQVVVSDEEQRFEWNQALEEIREELTFLKRVRGGRLNALKFKLQNPREALLPRSRAASTRSRSSSIVPQTPNGEGSGSEFGFPPPSPDSRGRRRGRSRSNSTFGPAAAMAGIVAGSIAGWSPVDRAHGDADSIRFSRSRGREEIDGLGGAEVHAATKPDDPVVADTLPDDKPPSQAASVTPDFGPTASKLAPS